MCLLIVKPHDKTLPDEHLREGFDSNRDGWGIAYIDPATGAVKVRKGVSGYPHFKETYDRILEENGKHSIMVHFRLATHGARDSSMCHPFYAAGGTAVAHNGIMHDYSQPKDSKDDPKLSDTARFLRDRLNPAILALPKPSDIYDAGWRDALGKEIGSFNKVAILTPWGGYSIINAQSGHWKDGVWYSNDGYQPAIHGWDDDYCGRVRWRQRDREKLWKPDTYTTEKEPSAPTNMKEFQEGQIECEMCNCHVKGRFYIEYGDEQLFVFCPDCASIYMNNGAGL